MNRLMISAAIAAMLLPAAACNKDRADTAAADASDDAATDSVAATADATGSDPYAVEPETPADSAAAGAVSTGGVAYLGPDEISAEEFVGDDVYSASGDKIARIEDVLIGTSGKAEKLILTTSNDLFGFDGKGSVDFSQVKVTPSASDRSARATMTDAAAKTAVAFDQAGLNDYRLASEILGTQVDIAVSDDDEAVVKDLILGSDGAVDHLIVQRSAVGVGGGDLYALDYSMLGVEQGDGGLILNATEAQLSAANKFEYTRKDAAEESQESMQESMEDDM